jgi:hypothetical protein
VAQHPQANDSVYTGAPEGCGFILDEERQRRRCGALQRPGSSYCAQHHALCHLPGGSKAEAKRLREVEALAAAVGGRRAIAGTGPTRRFLKKLEQAVRPFS